APDHKKGGKTAIGLDTGIAKLFQAANGDPAHPPVILDNEDSLPRWHPLNRFGGALRHAGCFAGVLRQVETHGRPMPKFAVELDMAARLFHEAIDHAQTEPAANARSLRRIEWLEGVLPYFLGHARAGIGYRKRDIPARQDLRIGGGVVLVDLRLGRLDNEPASFRHRVAGVDRQVEECIFDLARIGHDRGQPLREADLDLHSLTETAPQKAGHASGKCVKIGWLRVERLAAPEGEQPFGELGAKIGRLPSLIEDLAMLWVRE